MNSISIYKHTYLKLLCYFTFVIHTQIPYFVKRKLLIDPKHNKYERFTLVFLRNKMSIFNFFQRHKMHAWQCALPIMRSGGFLPVYVVYLTQIYKCRDFFSFHKLIWQQQLHYLIYYSGYYYLFFNLQRVNGSQYSSF